MITPRTTKKKLIRSIINSLLGLLIIGVFIVAYLYYLGYFASNQNTRSFVIHHDTPEIRSLRVTTSVNQKYNQAYRAVVTKVSLTPIVSLELDNIAELEETPSILNVTPTFFQTCPKEFQDTLKMCIRYLTAPLYNFNQANNFAKTYVGSRYYLSLFSNFTSKEQAVVSQIFQQLDKFNSTYTFVGFKFLQQLIKLQDINFASYVAQAQSSYDQRVLSTEVKKLESMPNISSPVYSIVDDNYLAAKDNIFSVADQVYLAVAYFIEQNNQHLEEQIQKFYTQTSISSSEYLVIKKNLQALNQNLLSLVRLYIGNDVASETLNSEPKLQQYFVNKMNLVYSSLLAKGYQVFQLNHTADPRAMKFLTNYLDYYRYPIDLQQLIASQMQAIHVIFTGDDSALDQDILAYNQAHSTELLEAQALYTAKIALPVVTNSMVISQQQPIANTKLAK